MFTESIQTAIRAMKLALRLRTPLRKLRKRSSYTIMGIICVAGIITFGLVYVLISMLLPTHLAIENLSNQTHYLSLIPTKFMYIFAGLMAAGLRRRFSVTISPKTNSEAPLLQGTPGRAYVIFLGYCMLLTMLYIAWTYLSALFSVDIEIENPLYAYFRSLLFFLHIAVDALPFIAAAHLYVISSRIKVEDFWSKTTALIITGYIVSCFLASCYYMSVYGLEIIGTLKNSLIYTGLFNTIIIILVYGFGLPAFVLLTHAAFTETEDNFQFDFESEN